MKKTRRFLVESVSDIDDNQPNSKSLNNFMKYSRKTINAETEGNLKNYGGEKHPSLSNVKRNEDYKYVYI